MLDKTLELKKFDKKIYLSSPTRHGDEELSFIKEAFDTNWLSTVGANIEEIEKIVANRIGVKYAISLSCGTAALHMSAKLAGIKPGVKVACSDITFAATVNPMVYEGAETIFIDTETETWNMNPKALERAFKLYPDIKVVAVAHLYGTPGKIDEIYEIAHKNGAVVIEDAAESLGATYKGKETGSFGDYNVISFNGNKIITGSSGGMFLTNSKEDYERVKKWSTQSRESAPWYQHEELGYNYRMSNLVAGMVRGQIPHLEEHIDQKTVIFNRYKKAFEEAGIPVEMNPYDKINSVPNFWLSCMIIKKEGMCKQERSDLSATFIPEHGKSCPTEILEAISSINAEGRPIWKPMHVQPIYKNQPFIKEDEDSIDVGMDIFERGLCLPSDNKMTEEQQNKIIEVIIRCFD